ncbi:MAG: phosphoribosylaminoimidazolesuccinocarboxamide synthase [Bacillota bacterium]|nr:phosphoribosylaminoimidazolesuccinocarboxamide synthase [Bacillota bacterium]
MTKGERLYEGKAKIVYITDDPDLLLIHFKDDATAFNGQKKGTISDKGVLNARISAALFRYLAEHGVANHFVDLPSEREMVARRLSIVPLEVVVRNVAAGSLAKRLGLAEGTRLARTVLEFYYKRDDLGDPLVNEYHIRALDLATPEEVAQLAATSLRVNDLLAAHLKPRRLELIDFKLEFGRTRDGQILLGDEISPDTCRFWDTETGERLDKDRFRRDLGGVEEAYQEVWRRIAG